MGRPGSALDNAVIESFHSTLEFELRSLEDFPTQAAARTRVAAWIDEYNTIRRHSAIAMIFPGRLGSHPERRAGSTNARARRAGNQGDGSAAHPGVRRAGYGPPLRAQGCCASLTRRPCGPALTPETSANPRAAGTGRPCLPCPARGAQARYHQIGSLYGSRGLPRVAVPVVTNAIHRQSIDAKGMVFRHLR
jgi:hypothetical protein